MARNRTILSGDFVLKIMQHGRTFHDPAMAEWQPATLDVCCGAGPAAGQFASYLEEHEQYTSEAVENVLDPPLHPSDAPHTVCTIRLTRHRSAVRHINIIATSSPTSTHGLPTAWNTTLMAFVSANGVTIPYPEHMRRGIGILSPLSSLPLQDLEEVVAAYQIRGLHTYRFDDPSFRHGQFGEDANHQHFYCPHANRSFLDDACWTFPFTSRFRARGRRELGHHAVEWMLGGQACSTCQLDFAPGQLYLTPIRHQDTIAFSMIRYAVSIRPNILWTDY